MRIGYKTQTVLDNSLYVIGKDAAKETKILKFELCHNNSIPKKILDQAVNEADFPLALWSLTKFRER